MTKRELWIFILAACVLASCMEIAPSKGSAWSILKSSTNTPVFSIVPQDEITDAEWEAAQETVSTPAPVPTPEQVGSWIIYRFPKRISIPSVEE